MNTTIDLSLKSSHDMSLTQDMIDALRAASVIPEGMTWGDYFLSDDDYSAAPAVEPATSVASDDWEIVGEKTDTFQDSLPARAPRWCKNGNACPWADCQFRHERCEHYDKWVSTRGRTRGCRCQESDPHNCRSPEEGGCKYDHRDLSKLRLFSENLPCSTEYEFLKHFGPMDVEQLPGTAWDTSFMTSANRKIMIRSLDAAKVEYDLCDTWVAIYFNH
jgi:hypothetical protein